MPPVNLNSLWVRQRIAANYYVVMAYQGSWWIKGCTNETLNDNIKWNQQSLQGFFWTRSKGTYSPSFLIISITKLSRRHVNLKRSYSSGSYCYRWEWGIAYWVLGLVSYDILRKEIFFSETCMGGWAAFICMELQPWVSQVPFPFVPSWKKYNWGFSGAKSEAHVHSFPSMLGLGLL